MTATKGKRKKPIPEQARKIIQALVNTPPAKKPGKDGEK